MGAGGRFLLGRYVPPQRPPLARSGGPVYRITKPGLREARRAMEKVAPELRKELKAGYREMAEQVATGARGRASSAGGVAAKVAPTIRAGATATGAYVAFGRGQPFAEGAEYGSFAHKQFKAWRGSGPEAGYFYYPTVRAQSEQITEQLDRIADKVMRPTES